MGYPTVFPTGVLVYNKEKAYNGYTIYPSAKGALLIDMNGNEVNLWAGLGGFPNKILPGGYVMGTTGERGGKYAYQDQLDLVQVDYDGNIVWKFDHTELIADPGKNRPGRQDSITITREKEIPSDIIIRAANRKPTVEIPSF